MRERIIALSLLFAGCTTTRYVTPWLRTTVHEPFVIMAESGGPKRTSMTEMEVRGDWKVVSHQSQALALPDDDRAIFVSDDGLVLAKETGEVTPLDCPGHVRVDGDRKRIVCVDFVSWASEEKDLEVSVTTLDYRTGRRTRSTSTVRSGTLPRSYFPHFPGFLKDGTPALTVHTNAENETFGFDQTKLCAAFALRGSIVKELASIESNAWPDCDEARFWNSRTDVEIEAGESFY